MVIKHFAAETTQLQPGINLIEASAGTGKTYAIAMLALRFIVEQNIRIDQLLIVTFTNAATRELKERVRSRLIEARQALAGSTSNPDRTLLDWIESLVIAKEEVKRRLDLALLDMDQAGIFTIHGFCQRVLKEHALESGQLMDAELYGDISAIRQTCADDFWRQQVYQREAWAAALLMARYATPDELLKSVADVPLNIPVYPELLNLDEQFNKLSKAMAAAHEQLLSNAQIITNAFADNKFKGSYSDNFDIHVQDLTLWLKKQTLLVPTEESLSLLTTQGLRDALNGHKFRGNKTQSSAERKQDYLHELGVNSSPFDELQIAFKTITLTFRRALVEHLRQTVEQQLLQLNLLSFDNLITRLAEVLSKENGALLIAELQQRFKVALIDEFQDTDDAQWQIFSTLFGAASHFLFLIGDPKQAVYKFRGADIYSYFAAQQQAQHHYTLDRNWRSHPLLVSAVNTLFNREYPFCFSELEYIQVKPALSAAQGILMAQGKPLSPMVLCQLEQSDSSTGAWTSAKAGLEIQVSVVNEILTLLDEKKSVVLEMETDDKRSKPIRPEDIAILVRTNAQASEYQAILREVGIPAVLNSTQSVFASDQAKQLLTLLHAIAHPANIRLIKQALTLPWFNLDGQTLYQVGNDETLLDYWLTRFQDYYQLWLNKSFMTMMLQLLEQEKVQIHIAQHATAERQLTNLHQLLELAQQAAADEHLGVKQTLDWLHQAIVNPGSDDEQQLRLESDAQAVNIVTMHRAKGLEYAVVFCPCLWQRNGRLNKESELIKCHDSDSLIADLGSEEFEQRRQQALTEELAEDIRLFYVAVTRAKYRCYITWADVRTKVRPNQSAMAYLFFNQEDIDYATQQNILQNLCSQAPDVFSYESLKVQSGINGDCHQTTAASDLLARQQTRSLSTYWQMSSYTALSALSLQDVPELPKDKVREPLLDEVLEEETQVLPKGAHTGNVVHDLLEHISFKALAEGEDISVQRNQACLRYGLKLDNPELLDSLLHKVVQTPLSAEDPGFCLAKLDATQCLQEMPFYLALEHINARDINIVLQGSSAFQPLTDKQMQGYLTGFIDLVCAYQGRYYVMDYKTNSLTDYHGESLTQAMREHNYGLQYWIYTLVLHQYLQHRLPDYDYLTHFGGVRYLFVRGMKPDQAMNGVYQDYPDPQKLQALAELVGGN